MTRGQHQTASPEERMAEGHCPECHALLDDVDASTHEEQHWPPDLNIANPLHNEAVRRRSMLRTFFQARDNATVETTARRIDDAQTKLAHRAED